MPETTPENHTMLSTVSIDEEETTPASKKETQEDAADDSSMSENRALLISQSLPGANNGSLQSAFKIAKPRTSR